ncbi:acetate--CoA ligase [Persicirhabdus sediminis]|uniref:Acetyl-coenzyme A synthetase n=1 Tax=Persicirhabdus sediminis TaxID=454144 RepID=A0A8J7MIZ5_9BACT|nr:acetate--CoA ligase [Persicirhabdus sediminis]MBK1792874.1 acetate--CoA ligase [Persicirhabdus sediminis]
MSQNIENHLIEDREFLPSEEFRSKARISSMEQYNEMYKESIEQPDVFWAREANELQWSKPWDEVLDWQPPNAKWFVGGELNVAENCVDRHVAAGRGDKAAIIWEGEPGDKLTLSYKQLQDEVCKMANVLESRGVEKGQRVLIYMPMIPEASIAMLACARIGAIHSVVFGGFSAESILDRLEDCKAEAVITADGGWRRGSIVPLKASVDAALEKYAGVKTCVVVKRTENEIDMVAGRDVWWHEMAAVASNEHEAKSFDSETPLFILYTSGSTGKPKGILHSSGGYLTGAYTTCKYIFDMREEDVYWCTADVGWITGHSYITYGPLAMGATQLMYEGAPNFPDFGRFWQMIEAYKVSIFYTAPTAIRAFIKAGDAFPEANDLSSLRLLGTVGEPINPEAWMWYYNKIGGGRCPIVDTWWQTETGAIMIAPLPGCTPIKPGTCTQPFFGVEAVILDEEGEEVGANEGGRLMIRKPWPSMLRGIYGDPQRFQETYWNDFEGIYTVGDGARRDEKGNFWIVGRLDDVLNVSGHRLGTAEVESALVAHPTVAEAAVVGRPHEIKGQAVVAFVTLKQGIEATAELEKELRNHVGQVIGAIAKPDEVYCTPVLPKTRSGKIMRRLLKELVATGEVTGNVTTLEDFTVIEDLQKKIKS